MSTSRDPRFRACNKRKFSDGKVVAQCNDSKDEYMDAAESRRNQLYYKVLELFPEADPRYLRNLCGEREYSKRQLDKMINKLLSDSDYPRRIHQDEEPDGGIDLVRDIAMLKQVLPDADPNYLLLKLSLMATQDELNMFITNALETKKYPTYAECLRKQQFNAQTKQYTTEFSVKNFVKLFPDPEKHFSGPERKVIKVERYSNNYYDVLDFLTHRYRNISLKDIKTVFHESFDVLETSELLDKCATGQMKSTRIPMIVNNIEDIPLLQLLAYIKNKEEILQYTKYKKREEEKRRSNMKKLGLLLACSCCYDDEIIPDDTIYCQNNCTFCKPCIEKSVQISYGEGKLKFFCLTDCGAELTLQMIRNAVNPKLFSRIAQKKQAEEVKAAGIEGLEFCPFCDFGTIPAPEDKLFKCLNPECMKESCRSCKEASHVPFKCEEVVKKGSKVKRRTYVEDKMTDALIRKCYKCGLKFIKADGCNRITCSCGAMMCYICNTPVKNYEHFNGQGGDRHDLCPLFSDTNLLHKERVLQGAAAAKEELGGDRFKIDPPAEFQKCYDEIMKRIQFRNPTGGQVGIQSAKAELGGDVFKRNPTAEFQKRRDEIMKRIPFRNLTEGQAGNAINPKLFSRIAQKKQAEEVKAAGIEGLEFCPFCDFGTIPSPEDKLFKCLNPECMKKGCRSCKEASHVPFKCEKVVEKGSKVKKRTYVEDKMTNALIRKCYKCGLKFIKADGCNRITCSCGAMMCYICNTPVKNYEHFNGQGGDRHDLCPLFSDTNLLHKERVMQGAAAAKAELGGDRFKIDPTAEFQKCYDEIMKRIRFIRLEVKLVSGLPRQN